MWRALVAAALVLMLTAARAETVFTATNGRECKDSSKPEFGDWICPGPGGYAVHFMDEGNMVGVTIGPSRSVRATPATSRWMGAGKAFGDKVQWMVRGDRPKAAVLRIWRRKGLDDDTEIQELAVFAINERLVCPYAVVDIHHPDANETAAHEAEAAADWQCTEK
jgi:hypothetical protein